jgi:hypothetical protein
VIRIDDKFVRAGLVVAEQDLVPGCAAVFRPVHAAVGIRRRMVAERGDVDEIGIGRVHTNLGDDLRVGEADVRPGLAGVGRLVGAAALNDVAADVRLARADVDDVGIGRGNGDRTD